MAVTFEVWHAKILAIKVDVTKMPHLHLHEHGTGQPGNLSPSSFIKGDIGPW